MRAEANSRDIVAPIRHAVDKDALLRAVDESQAYVLSLPLDEQDVTAAECHAAHKKRLWEFDHDRWPWECRHEKPVMHSYGTSWCETYVIKGGQGRTDEEVVEGAGAVFWCIVLGTVAVAALLIWAVAS